MSRSFTVPSSSRYRDLTVEDYRTVISGEQTTAKIHHPQTRRPEFKIWVAVMYTL